MAPLKDEFEIRVGVLGYVSVGKTTAINALFGAEYGEVAMKRTTAVVNSYCIHPPSQDDSTQSDTEDENSVGSTTPKVLPASHTLEESAKDNSSFRNSNVVKEKTFNVSLAEPLHEMRPDTKLVVVDIPGLNEAGTSSKYKDFVNTNWHTFDIVVVVMDARQGVNTEEQLDLLKLVKQNLSASKEIPVIILGNKVDDPDNTEQKALLGEARSSIGKLFGVSDREKALQTLLSKSSKGRKQAALFPAFVPISAMHAFVYRCGSRLSFEEFCKMDKEFIENIGKDSYGRQWNRFGKKQKLEKAFQAVSEEEQQQDGVEASNFETFVKVLAYCIGDLSNQASLIKRQVDMSLKRMKQAPPDCDLAQELMAARHKLKALGKPVDKLPGAFWTTYQKLKADAIQELNTSFSPKQVAGPMHQLHNYCKALQTLQWPGEMSEVAKQAKELALLYAITVADSDHLKNKSTTNQALILGSMLLCSNNDCFDMHFGFLKLYLESKQSNISIRATANKQCYWNDCQGTLDEGSYGEGVECCLNHCERCWIPEKLQYCPNCKRSGYHNRCLSHKRDGDGRDTYQCNHCGITFLLRPRFCLGEMKMKVENGKLVPVDRKVYEENVSTEIPDSLEDPNHFGHVFWKCCQLLKESTS